MKLKVNIMLVVIFLLTGCKSNVTGPEVPKTSGPGYSAKVLSYYMCTKDSEDWQHNPVHLKYEYTELEGGPIAITCAVYNRAKIASYSRVITKSASDTSCTVVFDIDQNPSTGSWKFYTSNVVIYNDPDDIGNTYDYDGLQVDFLSDDCN